MRTMQTGPLPAEAHISATVLTPKYLPGVPLRLQANALQLPAGIVLFAFPCDEELLHTASLKLNSEVVRPSAKGFPGLSGCAS